MEVLVRLSGLLALLCVGATLQVHSSTTDRGATASVVAVKAACMPAIAWGVLACSAATPGSPR